MKEIAKMLKSFGPKYTLEWRMDYFMSYSLIITLKYFYMELDLRFQKEYAIPFDQVEHMDEHAPIILSDMHRAIREKIMDAWANK